jgi:hypothetical protein
MRPSTAVWFTAKGSRILEVLGSLDDFATEWQAHLLRSEAASRDARYKKDAASGIGRGYRLLAQATFREVVRGSIYFQDALMAVYNHRCTDAQLQLVLNELHPILKYKYGLYRPEVRDALGRKSSPARQVQQAKLAIQGFVHGPYERVGPQPLKVESITGSDLTKTRLAAEAILFLRSRDHHLPEAITIAQARRLVTAISSPKIGETRTDRPEGKQLAKFLEAHPDFMRAYREASEIDRLSQRQRGRTRR